MLSIVGIFSQIPPPPAGLTMSRRAISSSAAALPASARNRAVPSLNSGQLYLRSLCLPQTVSPRDLEHRLSPSGHPRPLYQTSAPKSVDLNNYRDGGL